jgi:putative ABC transport system permease protein
MRAIGASRGQIVGLITTEALLLTGAGGIAGVLLALAAGHGIENLVKSFVPLAPDGTMMSPTAPILFQSVLAGVVVGVLAGLYPAWRAGRLQPAEALKAE